MDPFEETDLFTPRAEEITAAKKRIKTYKPVEQIQRMKQQPGAWKDNPSAVTSILFSLGAWAPSQTMTSVEQLYDWLNERVMSMGPGAKRDNYEQYRDALEANYYTEGERVDVLAGLAPRTVFAGGLPVAQVLDYQGQTYLVKDISGNAQQLLGLEKTIADAPLTVRDWMAERGYEFQDVTQSQAWQGLDNLITELTGETLQEEWREGGISEAERLMGIEPGGYDETIGGMLGVLEAGKGAGQGLTEGEQSNYARQQSRAIKRMSNEYKDIVESLTGAGRSAEAFAVADTALQRMADSQLKHDEMVNSLDVARKEAEFDAVDSRWRYMVDHGAMTVSNYIQRQREHAGLQVTLYATRLQQIESANRQYLIEHQADMQALQQHADLTYKAITASLVQDEAAAESIENYYNAFMAPLAAQMQQDAIALEENQLAAQEEQNMWTNAIALLGLGASVLTGVGNIAASV